MTARPSNFTVFGSRLQDLTNCVPDRLPDALRGLTLANGTTGLAAYFNQQAALLAQATAGTVSALASQTATVAGVPAANDVLGITVTPSGYYTTPVSISRQLSAGDAVSATTAAAALVAQWNATAACAAVAVASNAAGVITLKPLWKGTNGNTYKLAVTKTGAGGTTFTAGGATFAGGTNLDDIPAII